MENPKERNVEFFISNIGGKDSAEVVDLNKIFQMNFSYNFDLLKNIMEALMKNQKIFQTELKEKTDKIADLENKISELKLSPGQAPIDTIKTQTQLEPSSYQQIEINKEPAQKMNQKFLSIMKSGNITIKAPPNDIVLDESSFNDEKTLMIIVSIIYIFKVLFRTKLTE